MTKKRIELLGLQVRSNRNAYKQWMRFNSQRPKLKLSRRQQRLQ